MFRQPEQKSSSAVTSAQVVETSVTTTDNSPSQDYTHLDDQTTPLNILIIMIFSYYDCQLKNLWLLNKFSLLVPKEMYREGYGEYGHLC